MHSGTSSHPGARSRLGASRRASLAHMIVAIAAIAVGMLSSPGRAFTATANAVTSAGGPLWILRFEVGAGPLDRGTDLPGAVLDDGTVDGLDTHTNAVVVVSAMHGVRRWLAAGMQLGAATHDLTMDSGYPAIGQQNFRVASWPILIQVEIGQAIALTRRLRPHADFSAGVALHTGEPQLHTGAPLAPVSLRMDAGVMIEAAAGVDWFLMRQVALNVQAGWRRDEVRYTLGYNAGPSRTSEMTLSQSCVRGGVTWAWTLGRGSSASAPPGINTYSCELRE